jgi:hypothetical protein
MKRILFLAALLLIAGCASKGRPGESAMDTIIKSWLGEHVERVVDQWGIPDGEQKIMGRTIYVWGGPLAMPRTRSGRHRPMASRILIPPPPPSDAPASLR